MARKIDITFNSETQNDNKLFQIASGYISKTTVLFEKENVIAVIEAKGSVEFYDVNDELIAVGKLPPVEDGKEVYEEVSFKAEGNLITLSFPVYEWIDNYPNCDGEHDRWDTRIVGYNTLTLDLLTSTVI